jgi:hypothetical protein
MDVTFYGQEAGSTEDFTIVLIPDAQNESQYNPAMFNAQTTWIVANKVAENIVFVTTTGDMVNNSSSSTEYTNADAAIDILDAGGVWYSVAPGNHDMGGASLFPATFGRARYADREVTDGYWFGGGYDDYNTYSLFSASGMDFILVNLQYSPSTAILDWADALLKTHSSRRAIVEEHDILNVDNSWNNSTSYNALKDNPNLFLMLCGHMHTPSDGAAYRAELGDDGHTIHVVQADYQEMSNGNGYLRILRFSPDDDKIYMTTYSPYTSGSITTSPDQMDLTYNMDGSAFSVIGTANDVASGANASVTWSGLDPQTQHEWYVTVEDAEFTTTSPTWDFTTGEQASSLVCETFNSLTPGSMIGSYSGWYDGGAGPVVTAGNGVTGSIGLAASGTMYNWTAYPFNWNATDF